MAPAPSEEVFAERVIGTGGRREDLAEQAGEFAPFAVFAAAAHGERQRFKAAEGGDFGFELADGARRRRLIEDLFLGGFDLVIRRVLKVLHVLAIERRRGGGDGLGGGAALQEFEFPQALLQAFAAPAQRLVDGLGRGCESPLQDGEREPDRARSLVIGERLGTIELLAHVVGDFLVEPRLGVRKLVRHGIGDALREKRRAVELEQSFLHHAAHQVGNVRPGARHHESGPRNGRHRAAP